MGVSAVFIFVEEFDWGHMNYSKTQAVKKLEALGLDVSSSSVHKMIITAPSKIYVDKEELRKELPFDRCYRLLEGDTIIKEIKEDK